MTYRLVWLEIAEDQYRNLEPELRTVVDRRLGRLLADPTGEPNVVYTNLRISTAFRWTTTGSYSSPWWLTRRPLSPCASPGCRSIVAATTS